MAKSDAPRSVTLTYPATTAYKQWVWKEIRRRGKTQQWLVDEMKRVAKPFLMKIVDAKGRPMFETISTSTITNLIGAEHAEEPPPPSNCSFMPAINKALEIAPPPVCDPTDDLAQLMDRFRDRWERATARERGALVALVGGEDDAPDVDRDRDGSGRGARRSG